MSLSRIAKLFAAQNLGQLVTVLTQLLLPPLFLHSYGVALYGEWLALSAAIGYLSTFNYGLQTYTNMQMTIHYNRGEVQECRNVQSAGLRILLATFAGFVLLLLFIFVAPIAQWLHLTISERQAQLILYLFGLQIVASMLLGFFTGSYMVIGATHRGTNFNNFSQLMMTVATACIALVKAPFIWIAAAQLCITLVVALYLIVDFSRLAPQIKPTLRFWTPGSLGAILKPSAQYALLYSSNFISYQLPVLVIQRILGPAAVVVYSVTRTIYSMSRRVLYMVTNSIGPEVTITFGERNWQKLHRLYDFSERIVLLLVAPITFSSMLLTPLLLHVWLHKPNIYNPAVCLLLGMMISVLSIKEHKYQFQFSSNQVKEVSYMTPVTYIMTLLISIPAMMRFQLAGFLAVWCLSEIGQLFYLLHLNKRLFGREAVVDQRPVYRLFMLLAVGTMAALWPVYHVTGFNYLVQAVIGAAVFLIALVVSYWLFKVKEIRTLLWQRVVGRFPALAARLG
jgi:O-antigen/teichoic acid export membrane protein